METQEYDLFVIGGGSGGLACSRQAALLGAKVGLADFVKPSPQNTTWDIGGTCVNVGCIPKKLMHFCALTGEVFKDYSEMGWQPPPNKEIGLNWGYKMRLKADRVDYFNLLASFEDSHTILLKDLQGDVKKRIVAKNILVAVGGRPSYGDFPGAKELCISSDDLFSLKKPPGKTLVVGASYIALECAGFIHSFGYEVQIMMRSIPLRGFDTDMANKVKSYMEKKGVTFLTQCVPISFEKVEGGIKVTYLNQNQEQETAIYETVLLAIGRAADTKGLNLQAAGVNVASNGKIICNEQDQSVTASHIYAVGDVQEGKPELTPVAIQAGTLLADRLFGNSKILMDYINVPTTVFSPIEYSCCGYTEEKAIEVFTQERVEIYHALFKPLEWQILTSHNEDSCYTKIIVDKQDNNRVVGIHFLGPNAGEVMQGFAVAIKAGLTYDQLEMTVGIHPTCAEEVVKLDVTKSSGKNAEKTGC